MSLYYNYHKMVDNDQVHEDMSADDNRQYEILRLHAQVQDEQHTHMQKNIAYQVATIGRGEELYDKRAIKTHTKNKTNIYLSVLATIVVINVAITTVIIALLVSSSVTIRSLTSHISSLSDKNSTNVNKNPLHSTTVTEVNSITTDSGDTASNITPATTTETPSRNGPEVNSTSMERNDTSEVNFTTAEATPDTTPSTIAETIPYNDSTISEDESHTNRLQENSTDGQSIDQYEALEVVDCGPGLWRRVAYLNMSDPSHQCPPIWREYSANGVRACGRPTNATGPSCYSMYYYSIGSYTKVCGRVIGYQVGSTDAFNEQLNTIDDAYVDGVSITYGEPRMHIWTYAAGLSNVFISDINALCTCAIPILKILAEDPPSFVGNNYYTVNPVILTHPLKVLTH